MSDEKLVEVASEKKEETKKAAPVVAKKEENKKEEVKAAAPVAVKASCDCEEKLQKLIAALLDSHPVVAKQIKKAGLSE
jgi:hypothetical protein